MKRLCMLAIFALALSASAAQAADWMFLPSYYSHHPAQPVQVLRQYSRGPVFTPSHGQYLNNGYRYTRSQIVVGGGTYEVINMWDSWYQTGAKY